MWPQEYIELKHIEELLVCGICYETMDTSVITSCSHSYCSLCIRKYLHYKTQCPVCFSDTFEKDLRKNKVLDEIIAQFLQVKDKLKRCLQIQIQFGQVTANDNVCMTPKILNQDSEKYVHNSEVNVESNVSVTENIVSSLSNAQSDVSSPSTSGRPKIPLMFTPKSSKAVRPAVTNMEDTKVVTCPVCKVTVSELHINRHLDDCLKRELQKDKPLMVDPKRKPLPKLVFSLMKDAVLRKKLKEFGLTTQGDRKTLEARLQRYIVLYNAECDKLNPRAISELIKQCEEDENIEKKINKTSFLNKLQVTRNTEQNIIEDERKKYLEANKDSFDTLIRKMKSIDSTKKRPVRRSLLNESTEKIEDIPSKRQAVPEKLDDSITGQKNFELQNCGVYIEDSDSDTSCPLQMYSSSEPNKLLNVELSPSNNNNSHNKSECDTNYDEIFSHEKFEINYSPLKVSKIEQSDSSDIFSDTFDCSKGTKSAMGESVCTDVVQNDLSGFSKQKMPLQRKDKLCLKNEVNSKDSISSSTPDFGFDSFNQEEGDQGTSHTKESALQDTLCHVFNNDNRKTGPLNHGTLTCSAINSSNLEKENIDCSPEFNGNSIRKRGRDTTYTDNKRVTPSSKKKIKRSSHYFSTEAKESIEDEPLSTLTETDAECSQSKPRLKKRLASAVKDTVILRKSARTKQKNNNS